MRLTMGLLGLAMVAAAACNCGPKQPDMAALEDEVRQADIAFDRAVAEGDLESFAALVAEDAVFFGSGLTEGRDAVVADWAPLFDEDSGTNLSWTPLAVEVASSGDLAVSRGDFRLTTTAEDGTVTVRGGSYVSAWRRSDDGRWRAILDIGTPAEPIAEE